MSTDGAREAFGRARAAQAAWSQLGAQDRAAKLIGAAERVAEDAGLADLMVSDVGKPIAEARAEVSRSAAILRYIASLSTMPTGELYEDAGGGQIRVLRFSRGVAVLITPWSFPAAIPTWKLAPALQAGNTVCLKAATQGFRIAERLVGHLHAAGVGPDVIQVIPGGAATATALLEAEPDAVSFTGSTATGRAIARGLEGRFVPLQLEMGGKNGVFVSHAADAESAARIALGGAMGYAGQKCTATSLLLVHEQAEDAVREALARQLAQLSVGDPRDDSTVVGPLIDSDQRDSVVHTR